MVIIPGAGCSTQANGPEVTLRPRSIPKVISHYNGGDMRQPTAVPVVKRTHQLKSQGKSSDPQAYQTKTAVDSQPGENLCKHL